MSLIQIETTEEEDELIMRIQEDLRKRGEKISKRKLIHSIISSYLRSYFGGDE